MQDLSPSLIKKRWQLNIDKKVSKDDMYEDATIIQKYLRDEDCMNEDVGKYEKASKRLSENIDLMVIKFIYKPKPGNGSFIGYSNLDEILNEARLQCLSAIYKFKFDYKKSKEIFCYLTSTIYNACRQMMNKSKRQRDIKLQYILNESNSLSIEAESDMLHKISGSSPKDFDSFLDNISSVNENNCNYD